jgi:hypothetical protein
MSGIAGHTDIGRLRAVGSIKEASGMRATL